MTVLLTGLLILLAPLLLLWAMQRQLMYFPSDGVSTPEAFGLTHVEPVAFTTTDAITLHGWWFPSLTPTSATVLIFNGNAGHRGYRAPLATALRRHGLNVLLFDYRGYGDNAGAPSERGLAADSRAAREYLAGRSDLRSLPLVYLGESLGAAVAIELAAAHPPDGLVLRSPFTSMIDIGRLHYPLLPVRWLLSDRYPSIDRIAGIRSPLLVIAGDRDTIIPIDNSRRLYDAAGSPNKQWLVVPGADHNDEALSAGDGIVLPIAQFVRTLIVRGREPERDRASPAPPTRR